MLGQEILGQMILGQNSDSPQTLPEWYLECKDKSKWAHLFIFSTVTTKCEDHDGEVI